MGNTDRNKPNYDLVYLLWNESTKCGLYSWNLLIRSSFYYKFWKLIYRKLSTIVWSFCSIIPLADTFFWLHSGDKTKHGFLVTSACLLSRKVWWVLQIGSFCPKLRCFTDQNGSKGGPHQDEFRLFKYKNESCKQLERKK